MSIHGPRQPGAGESTALEAIGRAIRDTRHTAAPNLHTKAIEIRDAGTFISVLAVRLRSNDPIQRYHLWRNGYPTDTPSVAVLRLNDGKAETDPYNWPENPRTMRQAHLVIERDFDALNDGDVVDVQFEIGETEVKKTSERPVAL